MTFWQDNLLVNWNRTEHGDCCVAFDSVAAHFCMSLTSNPVQNHAGYIQFWIQALVSNYNGSGARSKPVRVEYQYNRGIDEFGSFASTRQFGLSVHPVKDAHDAFDDRQVRVF